MASTFSTNAHIELQGTGDNPGTWGSELNTQALTIVDNVLGNVTSISLSNTDVTLNTAQTQVNYIKLSGTLTGNVNVIFPAIGRTYFISDTTTGAFIVTLKIGSNPGFVSAQGYNQVVVLDGTNVVGLTAFSNASVGNLTVTGSFTATGLVTNASLANMTDATVKGRALGGGTGVPIDLSRAQVTGIVNTMTGDSGSGGAAGLVPAPAAGTAAANYVLSANGTWAAPVAQVYVSEDAANTLFPIGTTLLLIPNSLLTRNQHTLVWQYSGISFGFTNTSSGPMLSGTWASRGGAGTSPLLLLVQRIA